MPSHTPMPQVSTLEVIETGSRRRWTLEEKQRIVAESFAAPRVVSTTARRHGLSTSQLFNWRRRAREGRLGGEDETPAFMPAIVAPDRSRETAIAEAPPPDDPPAHRNSGRIEIVLPGGSRVIVGNDVDAVALRRVLDVLERR